MAMSMLHRRLPAFGKSLGRASSEGFVLNQLGRSLTNSFSSRQLSSVSISKRLNLTCYSLCGNLRHNSSVSSASGTSSGTGLVDEVLKAKPADPANEPSEEEERKKRENSARAVKYTLYAMGLMAVGGGIYVFLAWGAPAKDRSGKEIRDEFSDLPFFEQYYKRAMSEFRTSVTYITDPSREKLLPDPPAGLYPPYTVILELTGILVHPDWTYKTGWRFKKRPGVDYFLQALAEHFEVVIYTQEQAFTAYPIIDALDKHGIASMRLFRDSTKYKDGIHTKDLDRINRDLRKTIIIDWNDKAVEDHRTNAIVLPKWDGSDDDRTLFDLAALLKTISTNDIDDVRIVLEYYAKFQDPMAEFRERQKQLAQQQIELEAMKKSKDKSGGGLQPNWSSFSNVFKKH